MSQEQIITGLEAALANRDRDLRDLSARYNAPECNTTALNNNVTREEFDQLKQRVEDSIQLATEAGKMASPIIKILEQFQAETNAKLKKFFEEHNAKIDGVVEQLDAEDDGEAWKKGVKDEE